MQSIHPQQNRSKRFEENKVLESSVEVSIPRLNTRLSRSNSVSEEAPSFDYEGCTNSDCANCLLMFHPWETGRFCEKTGISMKDMMFKCKTEKGECFVIDIGKVDYSKPIQDTIYFILDALSIVEKKEVIHSIAFIIMAKTQSEILVLIEALKRIVGKSVLECILSVKVLEPNGDSALTSFSCSIPTKPTEIFIANSFNELIVSSQDLLFATPISKIKEISLTSSHSKQLNLTAKVFFKLPFKSCINPLAALPGIVGTVSVYSLYNPTSSIALVSGVGILYTIARGLNYLTSSYVRNKGIIHIDNVVKAHRSKIKGENLRFRSASIVKNSSKLCWNSLTSSFDAYSCVIINEGRDILVSMRYWVDQFALSNLTSKAVYAEFIINCNTLYNL